MADLLDYRERPSKAVARRIMMSALQRLQAFAPLPSYSYVGFGSIQFVDFDPVHRQLGIKKMTSIESESKIIARCHYNRPYNGIKILEGTSGTLLPGLDWKDKAIVWLDYTSRLRKSELDDCQTVSLVLQPGSVLALTFNCDPNEDENERVTDLEKAVGSELVPLGTTGARLGEWGLAGVQRQIATQTITKALADRGGDLSWQQILNIQYRDGSRMQTIVGIIDHPDIHDKLKLCRFDQMPEVSIDEKALQATVPVLTPRERQALNSKLPGKVTSFAGIPEEKLRAYSDMYRWMDAPA
ncbi:O-methyltransferase [Nocardioides sp. B-3]|uniref:O-methyltransferase n=1 Tax=Nocardioides sp. B-3 TaxID=2895565 RepID=UPI0021520729|nr:O-methyltransferase [Nocardioides sp. B-3]UUZ59546.1 hypothetical protein LP418_27925 [Nocardioides sp. B-3]